MFKGHYRRGRSIFCIIHHFNLPGTLHLSNLFRSTLVWFTVSSVCLFICCQVVGFSKVYYGVSGTDVIGLPSICMVLELIFPSFMTMNLHFSGFTVIPAHLNSSINLISSYSFFTSCFSLCQLHAWIAGCFLDVFLMASWNLWSRLWLTLLVW